MVPWGLPWALGGTNRQGHYTAQFQGCHGDWAVAPQKSSWICPWPLTFLHITTADHSIFLLKDLSHSFFSACKEEKEVMDKVWILIFLNILPPGKPLSYLFKTWGLFTQCDGYRCIHRQTRRYSWKHPSKGLWREPTFMPILGSGWPLFFGKTVPKFYKAKDGLVP